MTDGVFIMTALLSLLMLIGGAAAFDVWARRSPRRYDTWVSDVSCPGCGTDLCTCDYGAQK